MQTEILKVAAIAVFVAFLFQPGVARSEPLNGAEQYARQCSRCHNPRGPMERSDHDWEIIVGHMRSVGDITGEESKAILEYLQANNNPQLMGAGESSAIFGETGKQIFMNRGCVACHRMGNQGGETGPSLDNVFSRRSRDYIVDQIRNSKLHNPASVMPQMNFSNQELESLLKYLKNE